MCPGEAALGGSTLAVREFLRHPQQNVVTCSLPIHEPTVSTVFLANVYKRFLFIFMKKNVLKFFF